MDDDQMSFADLAKALGRCEPTSVRHGQLLAEMQRRQLILTHEATEAQKRAAVAEENAAAAALTSAEAMTTSTKYLFWSVIVAAIAAIASAVSSFFTAYAALHGH